MRKVLLNILNWVILIAAWAYLIWRLWVTGRQLTDEGLLSAVCNWESLVVMLLAIAMVPLNIGAEAWRWWILTRGTRDCTFRDANKQTYYGQMTGFITPYAVGDFPGRILYAGANKQQAATMLGMSAICSISITFVIVAMGLAAIMLVFLHPEILGYDLPVTRNWVYVCVALALLMGIVLVVVAAKWKKSSFEQLLQVTGISLLRYLVWTIQLGILALPILALSYTGDNAGSLCLSFLFTVVIYWLCVTITPSMPAADAAVRGSWLMILMTPLFSNEPLWAIVAIEVWVVNTVIPVAIGGIVGRGMSN